MKKIITLLTFMLLASQAVAQVSTVKTAGTGQYFIQTADGDTLHLRGQTPFYNDFHVAHIDAQEYSADWEQEVYVRQVPAEYRVNANFGYHDFDIIEMPADTIWLPTDTVYVPAPGYESELLNNVDYVHSQSVEGQHHIAFEWRSAGVFNDISWRCIDEIPDEDGDFFWGRVDGDHRTFTQPQEYHEYSWTTDCNRYLQTFIWAQDSGWGTRKDEFINLAVLDSLFRDEMGIIETHFLTDFSDYDPDEWENIWGELTYWVQDETLFIEQPQNIARLQWLRIPEHRNARFRIVETIDTTHSTGVHVGMRTSPDTNPRQAAESYVNNDGLGVSYFLEGSWGNPVNFPFEWEYGQKIEYIVELDGNELRMKAWIHGENEPGNFHVYTNEIIDNIPSGFFALGSTGAGLYIIHEIEVQIW